MILCIKGGIDINIKQEIADLLYHPYCNIIKGSILQKYKFFPEESFSDELMNIIDFLKENSYCRMPYEFTKKYINREIPVYYDSDSQMVYIVENDKKLYFKRGYAKEQAVLCYNALSYEQDNLSPHRYLTGEVHMVGTLSSDLPLVNNGFTVNKGDVVIDIGAAEGNFSFSVAELASKLYLFEYDSEWIRALEKTFKDYSDKVIIIPKYVSNVDAENSISLDGYFNNNDVINFIKADVEGYEWEILLGMEKTLKRNAGINAAICTYHRRNNGTQFKKFFTDLNFETNFTPGYLCFARAPYFRRGVLRATSSLRVN